MECNRITIRKILPNIAKHQYRPTMSNLKSVGVVTNKSSLKHIKNLAGLIGKEQFFYSAVSRDVIDNPNYRAIVFHCRDEFSQEELLDKIIELLKIKQIISYSLIQKTIHYLAIIVSIVFL